MKQHKEPLKPAPKTPEKNTIREMTEQITHIIGKDPQKAAQTIEVWVKDSHKSRKKAA